jgi:hypoxanthine-DNA glycosylase
MDNTYAEEISMIETHPFGSFVPPGAKYLILGSFTGRQAVKGKPFTDDTYDWFYGLKRNQFWPILEAVYGRDLKNKQSRQNLLIELHIAMADIIYQCERKNGSNLDNNLINIVYATDEIIQILENNHINSIFFTSRYVEIKFRRYFKGTISLHPTIELMTLPSPSPRYAQMTKEEKIKKYIELLPQNSAAYSVLWGR